MEFTFSKRARTLTIGMMLVGVLAAAIGIMGDDSDHHQRSWATFFASAFFFLAISLGTLFFLSLQYATESAWSVLVKRVYEGMLAYLPIGAAVIVFCLLMGWLGVHHIWHWMDPRVIDPSNADHYDKIIADKWAYLNPFFHWVRTLTYLGVFIFFAWWFRRQSLRMDQMSGEELVKRHLANYKRGALFLVFFAVFSSMLAWDWIMSIDVHWYSTLFGWYVFSGMWVSAMIFAVITVLYLKRKGYLPQVNSSHIHDMGKWVFAISVLWTYLWFSQFMLYWYANIPEEVSYFYLRINPGHALGTGPDDPGFRWPFWGIFLINFILPVLLLIARDTKRNPRFLIGVGALIFFGHWLDVQMLVQPGAVGHWHLGLAELGIFLAFLGLFIYVTLTRLTKAPLTVVNHPYLAESVHHHI